MNLAQLKSDVHFLCGSTSATYADSDSVRNMNIAYQDVAREIWTSAGGWQYDDSNATTLPIAVFGLTHNQKDYSLPTTAQRLELVTVKDSAGNAQKLKQFDINDLSIAPSEYFDTPGMPMYYDLVGRSVMLYPTPSSAYATMASGMTVYVSRDVTEMPASGTTTVPGFATAFHRILSLAAAIDYSQDNQQKQLLAQQKQRLEKGLVAFYSNRNVGRSTTIRPSGRKKWRQYT